MICPMFMLLPERHTCWKHASHISDFQEKSHFLQLPENKDLIFQSHEKNSNRRLTVETKHFDIHISMQNIIQWYRFSYVIIFQNKDWQLPGHAVPAPTSPTKGKSASPCRISHTSEMSTLYKKKSWQRGKIWCVLNVNTNYNGPISTR